MNRPFTTREKVMLVILCLLVIGIGYYKLILEPINTGVEEYQMMEAEEQDVIVQNMALVQKKNLMEQELEELFAQGEPTPIPSYDNFGKLIVELHSILDSTTDYSLSFAGTMDMTGGYLKRRPVQLSFNTGSYGEARSIIDRLHGSTNINQISDLNITINKPKDDADEGSVSVSMVITYFELIG